MIRRAGIDDFDRIMELMINFANTSPLTEHHNPQYNTKYVKTLLCGIMKNGVIIVGEKDGEIQGILIASIVNDPWLPEIRILREMAWWVEPCVRESSLGYKLLKKYIEYGEKMKHAGVIDQFMLTLMEISPDFDLEKRGWYKAEQNYMFEGVK
jgi:N-acetylglutamate synthase-like GNAT family acetyltransferase